jgi:hypothetical protein
MPWWLLPGPLVELTVPTRVWGQRPTQCRVYILGLRNQGLDRVFHESQLLFAQDLAWPPAIPPTVLGCGEPLSPPRGRRFKRLIVRRMAKTDHRRAPLDHEDSQDKEAWI